MSFSIPRSISAGCSAIANNNRHFWHKKLGYPNSVILTHLTKHGYLSNTNGVSSLSFDCACHAPVLGRKGIRELEKNKIIHKYNSFYI
jgi:hypothetical protein